MNGAESLVHTLIDGGVDVCFANPGTSEMHFVAALDKVEGMRCVLGLFEGVVTGAADGYYRMAERPAATLLHLGPGLANGLANLHNAKKARSGIVNVVGDHATEHLKLDSPLTSDIEALARPMSGWVRTSRSSDDLAVDGAEAIAQANRLPGQIATLILPANTAWMEVAAIKTGWINSAKVNSTNALSPDLDAFEQASRALREGANNTLILLGGRATRAAATHWAGRIAAVTGCAVMSEFYAPRIERGAGRVAIPRLPYSVESSLNVLRRFNRIVLVSAKAPVAFFAYPGKPGRLTPPGCEFIELAGADQDVAAVLKELCENLGASAIAPTGMVERATSELPEGPLDVDGIGRLLAALIPENAIVVDEAISTGRKLDLDTRGAAPHDWLTNMGGAIGYGLPAAIGAAIAAPSRRVLALEGDGSAMYTLQSLWTMVRESLKVTVVIFANRSYNILHGEFAQVGAGAPGQRAHDMLTLDRPTLDWCSLARGMGMECSRVTTLRQFGEQLQRSFAIDGPSLIEVVI